MSRMSSYLKIIQEGNASMEDARDSMRDQMHLAHPDKLPYGLTPTSVDHVALALCPTKYYRTGTQSCPVCGFADRQKCGVFEASMSAGLSARRVYLNEGVPIRD